MGTLDPGQIADRLQIRDLMTRYAMAVDRRDWDLYRSVFRSDAVIDYSDSGGPRTALEPTVAWLAEVLAVFAGLQHNMTNHVAEIDGDVARACTYYVAYHTLPDGAGAETVLVVGGFYQDRLARTPDGWRITERVELGQWMEGPYPDDVAKPPWYGASGHHRPSLPG